MLTASLTAGQSVDEEGVYTKEYDQREFSMIRGFLRGVTRPVALTTLSNKYKIKESTLKKRLEYISTQG
jgi:hypothetical protein